MIWDTCTINQLRDMWEQTNPRLSTKEIGFRLHTSKNSIVGKAHRIGLKPRPSPIKRDVRNGLSLRVGTSGAPTPYQTLPELASINGGVDGEKDRGGVPVAGGGTQVDRRYSPSDRGFGYRSETVSAPSFGQSAATELAQHRMDHGDARSHSSSSCAEHEQGSNCTENWRPEKDAGEVSGAEWYQASTCEEYMGQTTPMGFVPVIAFPYTRRPAPTCCWPIGDPGTKSFRFCDAPSGTNRPYCPHHASIAYVRVRDRRGNAA